MNIAVVDAGGNLVAHVRMDNAWIGSVDISIKKAWTVARLRHRDEGSRRQHSQSGEQFFGIHASNGGKVMIFAGGIPLKRDGQVVGAIGVSGGTGEQDQAVAEAGRGRSDVRPHHPGPLLPASPPRREKRENSQEQCVRPSGSPLSRPAGGGWEKGWGGARRRYPYGVDVQSNRWCTINEVVPIMVLSWAEG